MEPSHSTNRPSSTQDVEQQWVKAKPSSSETDQLEITLKKVESVDSQTLPSVKTKSDSLSKSPRVTDMNDIELEIEKKQPADSEFEFDIQRVSDSKDKEIRGKLEYLRLVHYDLHRANIEEHRIFEDLPVRVYERAIKIYRNKGELKDKKLEEIFDDVVYYAREAAKKTAKKEGADEVEYPPWTELTAAGKQAALSQIKDHFTDRDTVRELEKELMSVPYPPLMSLTKIDKEKAKNIIEELKKKNSISELIIIESDGERKLELEDLKELVEKAKPCQVDKNNRPVRKVFDYTTMYRTYPKIYDVTRKRIVTDMAFTSIERNKSFLANIYPKLPKPLIEGKGKKISWVGGEEISWEDKKDADLAVREMSYWGETIDINGTEVRLEEFKEMLKNPKLTLMGMKNKITSAISQKIDEWFPGDPMYRPSIDQLQGHKVAQLAERREKRG